MAICAAPLRLTSQIYCVGGSLTTVENDNYEGVLCPAYVRPVENCTKHCKTVIRLRPDVKMDMWPDPRILRAHVRPGPLGPPALLAEPVAALVADVRSAGRSAILGFGRVVASKIEVPILLVNLV